MQPTITISFKNCPKTDFSVKTYIQLNNVTIDSIIQVVNSNEGKHRIWFYKKGRGGDIEEVKTKKFIVTYNNNSDTISQVNCSYNERKSSCDGNCLTCTIGEYSNFTFLYKNKLHTGDTLSINY